MQSLPLESWQTDKDDRESPCYRWVHVVLCKPPFVPLSFVSWRGAKQSPTERVALHLAAGRSR